MKRTNKIIEYQSGTEKLAAYAKALSHPVRIKILKYLNENNTCHTSILMESIPLAQSTISQHLKELRNAGLIKGELDLPKIKYCIDMENWEEARTLFCDLFDIDFNKNSCSI